MEPNPHGKKDHPSDPAPSAGPNLAGSQAMSRKRSNPQANAELTSVPADQPMANAETGNLGESAAKRPKGNRHSSFMWAGDEPHKGWKASYVAMTKCDFCSLSGRGVVHQCNDCKLTVCGECVGKGELEGDQVHNIKPGSLNWELPKKPKAKAPRHPLPPKPPGGKWTQDKGAKSRGGPSNGAPGLVGPLEQRPFGGTTAGPWATPLLVHGGEINHNGAQAPPFGQIVQPPAANFQFRYPYPIPPPVTLPQSTGPSSHSRNGNQQSSHARNGNQRRQDTPFKIESTDISHPRNGAARVVPTPLDLSYLQNNRSAPKSSNDLMAPQASNDQTARRPSNDLVAPRASDDQTARWPSNDLTTPRLSSDLTAISQANQINASFIEYIQRIQAKDPSRNPGVQLPSIDELFKTLQPQSQPASNTASNTLPDPVRPRQPREKPTSARPLAWGADLEAGDLHRLTQSEAAAFQAILGATYTAINMLSLHPVKSAARQWVCEQEQKIKDKGVNPFGL
ncbi:unnamed protein product [Clonostachys byssicola]|uniref:Uncharacterized protein n=1 Tax=Clonostachys byssicola TaxID=160290 RepID=A0A9N9US98_9HYPO|nr:unnamed protein product [Clonostachys byssicola]